MAHGWVNSGMKGLRPSRAGFLRVSPAVVRPTRPSALCTMVNAPATASPVQLPAYPSVSTLVRKADGHSSGRGLATLNVERCTSGALHRRNTREVQVRRMHTAFAPPFSTRKAGLRQAQAQAPLHAGERHPSGLPAWSRFFVSTDTTTPKKPHESPRDDGVDAVPVAEADVAEVPEPTQEEPRHAHIEMPSITDVGVQTGASLAGRDPDIFLISCCF